MQEKDVFISYKSEELNEAKWVEERLKQEGISCWLAPGSIPGGSSYAAQIPRAIRECVAFVLILSKNAQESKWVPRELDQAINANKVILPFTIEDCPLRDDFSFYLSNVQRYEAWQNREKAFDAMVRVIRTLIDARNAAGAGEASGMQSGTGDGNAVGTNAGNGAGAAEAAASAVKKNRKEKTAAKRGKQNAAAADGNAGPAAGSKKKSRVGRIFLIAAAVLAVLIVGALLRNSIRNQQREQERISNAFSLAGREVSKTDSSLSMKDAAITAEDLEYFILFEKLGYITLKSCTFEAEDLSPILNENLWRLDLVDCNLTPDQLMSLDFSKTPKLAEIDLSGNPLLGELSGWGDFSLPEKLKTLRISNTGISDLTPLAPLEELTFLEAENNGIKDISPLEGMGKLVTLDLKGNALESVESLKGCTALTNLNAADNQLTSLNGIEACIRMDTLDAAGNQITDLEALSNMTILKTVHLAGNNIESISVLAKSSGTLEELDLTGNAVSDISPIKGCTALKTLLLRSNEIQSMRAVQGLENLITLDLSENKIVVPEGLSHLKSLHKFDISDNPLAATLGFWGAEWPLAKDIEVDASNCGIREGMTLQEGQYYYLLDLHGSNFLNIPDAVAEAKGNTVVLDWIAQMKPEKLKELGFNSIVLLDVPLDQVVSLEDTLGRKLTHMSTEEYESKKAESE